MTKANEQEQEQAMSPDFFAALDQITDLMAPAQSEFDHELRPGECGCDCIYDPPCAGQCAHPGLYPADPPAYYDRGQYQPFRVEFEMDGTGVSFAPGNPIHLDSLLVWAAANLTGQTANYRRDDAPADEVPLPLREVAVGPGQTVWAASAILPQDDAGRAMIFESKRWNYGSADWVRGAKSYMDTIYKNRRDGITLVLCRRMVAYGCGDIDAVAELLTPITGLGARRSHGHGKIISKRITPCDEDFSVVDETGRAMRWLPNDAGFVLSRMKPPYWNKHGQVLRSEIGDDWLATENGLVYGGGVRGTAPAVLDLAPQETGLHRGAYAMLKR